MNPACGTPDAIERALAHGETGEVRAAYHSGQSLGGTSQHAQWWNVMDAAFVVNNAHFVI